MAFTHIEKNHGNPAARVAARVARSLFGEVSLPGDLSRIGPDHPAYSLIEKNQAIYIPIQAGTRTKAELLDFMRRHAEIYPSAESMLMNDLFTVESAPRQIDLLWVRQLRYLGITDLANLDQIGRAGSDYHLGQVGPEGGPDLIISPDMPNGTANVYMKTISASDGCPTVFHVSRDGDDRKLYGYWALPGSRWNPGYSFVFGLRKLDS